MAHRSHVPHSFVKSDFACFHPNLLFSFPFPTSDCKTVDITDITGRWQCFYGLRVQHATTMPIETCSALRSQNTEGCWATGDQRGCLSLTESSRWQSLVQAISSRRAQAHTLHTLSCLDRCAPRHAPLLSASEGVARSTATLGDPSRHCRAQQSFRSMGSLRLGLEGGDSLWRCVSCRVVLGGQGGEVQHAGGLTAEVRGHQVRFGVLVKKKGSSWWKKPLTVAMDSTYAEGQSSLTRCVTHTFTV